MEVSHSQTDEASAFPTVQLITSKQCGDLILESTMIILRRVIEKSIGVHSGDVEMRTSSTLVECSIVHITSRDWIYSMNLIKIYTIVFHI